MEPTYAYSAWIFTRALCVVYLVAFVTLALQAQGLWGSSGIMPMAPFMKAVEGLGIWEVPSVFWFSTADQFILGSAWAGAVFALLALVGVCQGWCLLICFLLYLSFCSSGQGFMAFQWDGLLCEVGFLALFTVPWTLDYAPLVVREPSALVRLAFTLVLFKLMFLSGVVKLMSGDEAWRDLTALKYHYWTQPLPNPLSPFMHALPEWVHRICAGLTFMVELILPFFIFWSRTRLVAATGFILLSLLIMFSGNYAFFNWLTLALCCWLIPDWVWAVVVERLPFRLEILPVAQAQPVVSAVMVVLVMMSGLWIVRNWWPDSAGNFFRPVLEVAQTFRVSNSYGLFAVMTKTRPEIVIEGSADGTEWKEYEFKFKPGPLDRAPPFVAPYHPRLDWQLWFAALGSAQYNPWIETLLLRLFENAPGVTKFLSLNPFPAQPPKYLRARLFEYQFTAPTEILKNSKWWTREWVRDYTPTYTRP